MAGRGAALARVDLAGDFEERPKIHEGIFYREIKIKKTKNHVRQTMKTEIP